MKSHKISQNDCAKLVDCDTGNFARLLNNEEKREYVLPGTKLAGLIESVFGVKTAWWSRPAPGRLAEKEIRARTKRAGSAR